MSEMVKAYTTQQVASILTEFGQALGFAWAGVVYDPFGEAGEFTICGRGGSMLYTGNDVKAACDAMRADAYKQRREMAEVGR